MSLQMMTIIIIETIMMIINNPYDDHKIVLFANFDFFRDWLLVQQRIREHQDFDR